MNVDVSPDDPPSAEHKRTWWPYLIWLLPLAALLIVGFLAVQWLLQRGEEVTVTFAIAGRAAAGSTKVLYQGVEAGHLVKIVPNRDGRRLDFKLRLVPEAKPGLNTNARFWLIGASPNFSDLSSLRAVVSGVAIGYAPGYGGKPTRRFEGLEKEPIVLPGDKGTHYVLDARTLGPIRERSDVLFHGQAIGKITQVKFRDDNRFDLDIFVFKPYDSLVKEGVRFWRSSPVRLSVEGGGVNATLAPASTILAGGVDLENSTAVPGSTQSPEHSRFKLYANFNAARQGLSGPTVTYDFAFMAAAGNLERGAPVTLLGFDVGEVESARLSYDEHTRQPLTRVTALLYPEQLDPDGSPVLAPQELRAATDNQVRQLLHFGFRARLEQRPPLVGIQSIALVAVKGAGFADLTYEGQNPRIPSAPGATGIDDITLQADQILAKINRMPLEKIGQDIAVVTGRLRSLAQSPKVDEGLAHLTSTLAEIDKTMLEVRPQVGPLIAKLSEAAGQIQGIASEARQLLSEDGAGADKSVPEMLGRLNEALRSIQSLADYLDRHPEALIRGKRPDK